LGFEEIVNCFAADGLLKARAAGVFTKQIMANPAAATLAGPAGRGQTGAAKPTSSSQRCPLLRHRSGRYGASALPW